MADDSRKESVIERKLVTYTASKTMDVTTFETEKDENGKLVARKDADWMKAMAESHFTIPQLLTILEKEAYKHIAKCEDITYWREVLADCKGWNFNHTSVESL